jgi:hypothetical protein
MWYRGGSIPLIKGGVNTKLALKGPFRREAGAAGVLLGGRVDFLENNPVPFSS